MEFDTACSAKEMHVIPFYLNFLAPAEVRLEKYFVSTTFYLVLQLTEHITCHNRQLTLEFIIWQLLLVLG